jgi:hypothetical protein
MIMNRADRLVRVDRAGEADAGARHPAHGAFTRALAHDER